MEIDKLKHQTNNSFYLIIFIYTLKVALPARLLKAPLLRPEGSALLPWRERDSRHQLMTIYWHSILVLYSFQYHSLIQQQGRNLMEIHGIFVQFVDLFPLFPSSLFFIAFWWLTSRYLAWSCALSTSVHMWEAYHYNKHPPHSMSYGNHQAWGLKLQLICDENSHTIEATAFLLNFRPKNLMNILLSLLPFRILFQLSETNMCFIFWYNLKPCHAMNAACNTWMTPDVS